MLQLVHRTATEVQRHRAAIDGRLDAAAVADGDLD